MRERRLRHGSKVIFDYKELFISKAKQKGMKLVVMRRGPISWQNAEGLTFWSAHPYKWVTEEEAEELLKINKPNLEFREATIEDVEDYYADD